MSTVKPKKIVGIMLIKNEDLYIERVLQNILNFCDQLIIAENYSQDRTYEIVRSIAGKYTKICLHRVKDVKESHELIEGFAGSDTWIFRVDGDEIYDPGGLLKMRTMLKEGAFQEHWCISGNMLNCTRLDCVRKMAKGYLAPPARAGMALYNFALIHSWVNCFQRTHSGDITFKDGYHAGLRYQLGDELSWDASYFRCLHTVFVKRSSMEKTLLLNSRWNPSESSIKRELFIKRFRKKLGSKRRVPTKIAEMVWHSKLFFRRDWKHQQYKRGHLVEKNISNFL